MYRLLTRGTSDGQDEPFLVNAPRAKRLDAKGRPRS